MFYKRPKDLKKRLEELESSVVTFEDSTEKSVISNIISIEDKGYKLEFEKMELNSILNPNEVVEVSVVKLNDFTIRGCIDLQTLDIVLGTIASVLRLVKLEDMQKRLEELGVA